MFYCAGHTAAVVMDDGIGPAVAVVGVVVGQVAAAVAGDG